MCGEIERWRRFHRYGRKKNLGLLNKHQTEFFPYSHMLILLRAEHVELRLKLSETGWGGTPPLTLPKRLEIFHFRHIQKEQQFSANDRTRKSFAYE